MLKSRVNARRLKLEVMADTKHQRRPSNPYRAILRQALIDQLARDDYLSPLELADVLELSTSQALHPSVHRFLIRFLRGEIKVKRGPKPKARFSDLTQSILEDALYTHALATFRKYEARRKRRGEKQAGPRGVRPSPHERAAKYVSKTVYGGKVSAATILNRRSLRKKKTC